MRMPYTRMKELMVANATAVAVRAAIAELDAAPGNVLFKNWGDNPDGEAGESDSIPSMLLIWFICL